MDVDPPAVEPDNPPLISDVPTSDTTSILPEEPVLNRDNPPEADQTLEEILDAVEAQDDEPIAQSASEAVVNNEKLITDTPEEDELIADLNTKPVVNIEEPSTDTTQDNGLIAKINSEPVVNSEEPSTDMAQDNDLIARITSETVANSEEPSTDTAQDNDLIARITSETVANSEEPSTDTAQDNDLIARITSEPVGNNEESDISVSVPETDGADRKDAVMDVTEPTEKSSNENVSSAVETDMLVDGATTPSVESDQSLMKTHGHNFNLGVPGLKFTANNVKTAKDGTKMVQIHQSQITPEQLIALQNNPNIKVVFRHVPSGKSYLKPPKHLLPTGKKRKVGEDDGSDVYRFDEGEDLQGPAKAMKYDQRFKYNYGSGKKKGKHRMLPDSSPYATNYMSASRPTHVMLTDLLSRINNPNAKKEIKVHTSQISAEVLANLELNPMYKIVLTTKQELPPLVIENVDAEEQAKLEKDVEEIEKMETDENVPDVKKEDVEEEASPETEESNESTEEEEKQRLEEEEREKKEREAELAKKMAEEEEELKKSVMQTQRSRAGRIRKPSKYALDIARLTKRKSVGVGAGESSGDESEEKVNKTIKKIDEPKETIISPPRGRGRPKKIITPLPPSKSEELKKDIEEADDTKIPAVEADDTKIPAVEAGDTKIPAVEAGDTKIPAVEAGDKKIPAIEAPEEKTTEIVTDESTQSVKPETMEVVENNSEKETEDKDNKLEEPEKQVTSTENADNDKSSTVPADQEPRQTDKNGDHPDPDTSAETSGAEETTEEKMTDSTAADGSVPHVEDTDESEVVDNKFRLRKLLEQCSTEEIRSVMLPEAFDSINIGDFLLYKAEQMHNNEGKISFPRLYKEFEALHNDANKEASRYNTLVKRANKVGGDKRMEKIVLMPVYNVEAANSLQISSTSIDAHICGIQRTITTEMIAANSFFIKSKMETPLIRLKLPEATAPRNWKPKQTKPLYTNQHQQMFTKQQEPGGINPEKPKAHKKPTYGQKIASMKYSTLQTKSQMEGIQVRRPAYFDQLKSTGQITLGGMSHQISSKATSAIQSIPVDANLLRADVQSAQVAASATAALAQLQAASAQQVTDISTTQSVSESVALNPVTGEIMSVGDAVPVSENGDITGQTEQYFVTEDGVSISAAATEGSEEEVRKHLVPIGDDQYVELPEGYSLIQTDGGYIIGQHGSTFTQGEDGNFYVTNSDGTTSEIIREVMPESAAVVTQEAEG